MPDRPLFRERALEAIDSLDGLDELITIVPARSWIALAAIGTLLLVLVVWGVFGRVPVVKRGAGIVSAAGGQQTAIAPAAGVLIAEPLPIGSVVEPGEVVARIRTAMLETVPLRAAVGGRVVDVRHRISDVVKRGDPIVTIEPQGARLSVEGFVEYSVRRPIAVGTAAELKPLDESSGLASPERGTIVAAAPQPASAERVAAILGNDRVARDPARDERSRSDDRRRRQRAASFPAGAPFDIAVVTDEVSPLQFLFPT